jgi:hypothetical protein
MTFVSRHPFVGRTWAQPVGLLVSALEGIQISRNLYVGNMEGCFVDAGIDPISYRVAFIRINAPRGTITVGLQHDNIADDH